MLRLFNDSLLIPALVPVLLVVAFLVFHLMNSGVTAKKDIGGIAKAGILALNTYLNT